MRAKCIFGGSCLTAALLWTTCFGASGLQIQRQAGAEDPSQEQDTVKKRVKRVQADDDEPGTIKQRAKKLLEQLEAQKKQVEAQLRSQLEQLEIQKKQLLEELDRKKAAVEEVARSQLHQLEETRKKLPELIRAMKPGESGDAPKPVKSKPAASSDEKLDQILERRQCSLVESV
jgi:hypothetical protein